jgi:predicted Zn-dependent protease
MRFKSILFLSTLFFVNVVSAQEDIVLKALQDEINRNLADLRLPDHEKPFFIMYGIVDQKTYSFSASLGSLTRSSDNHNRYRSTARVLVGDYSFNDESLDDDLFSSSTSNEIELPLEDDYWGIRRSFWSTTDKVYRDAAKNLQKNKESLKETGKELKDLPHRTFAKTASVSIVNQLEPLSVDRSALENRARKLSELFFKHPAIFNSGVMFNYIEGIKYLANSEGSKVKVPFRVAAFTSIVFSKTPEGEQYVNGITHFASTPDKLPTDAQLTEEINALIREMETRSSTPRFAEEYSGPVLMIGQSVAEIFASQLLGGAGPLAASDNITKLSGYQYDTEFYGNDSKVGKSIMHESITIVAKPKLKTFNGVDLLGSFDVDDECVVPSNEVTLVERGILKTLLNNRTLTSPGQSANGFSGGPGVLQINIASKDSEKALKKKLLDKAKKEGLTHAIIIRNSGAAGLRLLNIYKVSVKDGKEELLQGATIGNLDSKILKHILGASDNYKAYNLGNGRDNTARGGTGLTSFIVPEAVLFDELDINRFRMPAIKETEYVKNPLE